MMPLADWENAAEIPHKQKKILASTRNSLFMGAPNSGELPKRFADSIRKINLFRSIGRFLKATLNWR
jgi:hypothetical protein